MLGDRAFDAVPRIQAMLTDLYAATFPLRDTGDLRERGRNVEHWLRENHPELSEQARAASANAYTFDFK